MARRQTSSLDKKVADRRTRVDVRARLLLADAWELVVMEEEVVDGEDDIVEDALDEETFFESPSIPEPLPNH